MEMPRSRGAVSGLLIAILGVVAALAPFAGPYFDLSIGTDETWAWTIDKLWLSVLPGAAAFVGGLILMGSANRARGGLGDWLALGAGIWLVIGPSMALIWNPGTGYGPALGSDQEQLIAQLVYFYGTGAAITALAAFALGRLTIRAIGDPGVVDERPVSADAPAKPGRITARAAGRR